MPLSRRKCSLLTEGIAPTKNNINSLPHRFNKEDGEHMSELRLISQGKKKHRRK